MQDSQENRPNGWWDTFLLKMKFYLLVYPSIYAQLRERSKNMAILLNSILEWHAPNPQPQMLLLCKFCFYYNFGIHTANELCTLLMHILPPSLQASCAVCQQLLLWHLMRAQHLGWSLTDASGSWSRVEEHVGYYAHHDGMLVSSSLSSALPACKYGG